MLLHTGLAGGQTFTKHRYRSCGYDWGQVADALQISGTILWWCVKEAGCLIQKYSEVSNDE